jgi:hypothetical protein
VRVDNQLIILVLTRTVGGGELKLRKEVKVKGKVIPVIFN